MNDIIALTSNSIRRYTWSNFILEGITTSNSLLQLSLGTLRHCSPCPAIALAIINANMALSVWTLMKPGNLLRRILLSWRLSEQSLNRYPICPRWLRSPRGLYERPWNSGRLLIGLLIDIGYSLSLLREALDLGGFLYYSWVLLIPGQNRWILCRRKAKCPWNCAKAS